MTTITASTTVGIDLNPALYASPVVIGAGVTVSNPAYSFAVYAHPGATTFFVIENNGAIASGKDGGVYLLPGGAVTNAAGASITGTDDAIKIGAGAATVVNYGSIGVIGPGVGVRALGGSVTNATSGSISGGIRVAGAAGIVLNRGGISGGVAVATLVNYGQIAGDLNSTTVVNHGQVNGVVFGARVTNDASASIGGAINVTVGTAVNHGTAGAIVTTSGEVVNDGTASVLSATYPGASLTNAAAGYVTGIGLSLRNGGPAGITVVNAGRVQGSGVQMYSSNFYTNTIALPTDSLITNEVSGIISGGTGVAFNGSTFSHQLSVGGTVRNDGTIEGTEPGAGIGVYSVNGGLVTNGVSGLISGAAAGIDINVRDTLGTVINSGVIRGTAIGVFGEHVANRASGTIGGSIGVAGAVSLTNAGTIVGNGGTAVYFSGSSDLLVLDPGFAFSGIVAAAPGSTGTLELAAAASSGVVTGIGSAFPAFGAITIDPGAQWFLSGQRSALTGPISGFAYGDTIELTAATAVGSSFAGGVLTLDLAGGHVAMLDLPGTFTAATDFAVTNAAAGADVTVACFAAGTRILTSSGAVPVEELTPGDRIATAAGGLARIVWLGCQYAPVPPVRIRAGAFGANVPARDLLLSPDHAVFAGAALVPVRHLLNGGTIVREPREGALYFHIELAAHAVILADGLPCETYLDTGNRAAFPRSSRRSGAAPTPMPRTPASPRPRTAEAAP